MLIAVIGASGTVGAPLVDLLEGQGHEVRRVSRRSQTYPADLSTGKGLTAALDGVDAVVNAANGPASKRSAAVLVEGSRRLLEASAAHHVCVSIVGIEQVPAGYYRIKVQQEQVVKESGRPFSIVRATQFDELIAPVLIKLAKARLELRSGMLVAPVAAAEAAAVIARVATSEPTGGTLNLTGPETLTLSQLRVRPGLPLPLPILGKLRQPLLDGALTHPNPDVRGVQTYAQWLVENQSRYWRGGPKR